MKILEDLLGKDQVKYNEPMSKHTSMRVGGNAEIFAVVDNYEKLIKILAIPEIENNMIPLTIIGNGTNVIVKDTGIKGVVIKYTANQIIINSNLSNSNGIKYEEVTVDAGVINAVLAQKLLENEITGFEFAAGIPGTIGGAIVMNAGAFGGEMSKIVSETEYYDFTSKTIKVINNQDHHFDYRTSIFEKNDSIGIIIKTKLLLTKGQKVDIQQKMNEYKEKRMQAQPLDKPSAGSTFKRGDGFITAQLIDEAGLKGYTIGGAQVSTKHAGFIINTGNATAKDIIDLINYVKETIYQKYGKIIETEVRILG